MKKCVKTDRAPGVFLTQMLQQSYSTKSAFQRRENKKREERRGGGRYEDGVKQTMSQEINNSENNRGINKAVKLRERSDEELIVI